MLEWLNDRYYADETENIGAIDKDDPDAAKKICETLKISYDDHFDEEFLTRIREKQSILRSRTKDGTIIGNAKITALTQEDLADLLDLGEPKI